MKVTAIIPDNLIDEVRQLTHGRNITESLITALKEWIALRRIKELNNSIEQEHLEFKEGFTADSVRELNRKR